MWKTTRWLAKGAKIVLLLIFTFLLLEYGMRAVKAWTYDGCLYIGAPSINSRLDRKYGWMSPKSFRVYKNTACYGTGPLTYNEQGFRAPPPAEATNAYPIICILGDSTMQGYQIPDGGYLPHMLQHELEKTYRKPYVLPLAVGGYGTTQEWMLFEDFGRPLHPTILIWHWCGNDPQNNDYIAERCFGPSNNNERPRPYLEDGGIVIRHPYPLHICDRFDEMMSIRLVNGFLLKWTARPASELPPHLENGWKVADELIARVAGEVDHKIGLVGVGEDRAISMFRAHGFQVAEYSYPKSCTCLPKDSHPNTEGHRLILQALMPVLRTELKSLDASAPHN
ncbi:MAG TPA: SGNH/GDSL hydrolase family protein [Verrucomicrobiae bacterium]|nr:SGNH/GDSL hydrolase family protein [Verrucomicrobiae bacterium]